MVNFFRLIKSKAGRFSNRTYILIMVTSLISSLITGVVLVQVFNKKLDNRIALAARTRPGFR